MKRRIYRAIVGFIVLSVIAGSWLFCGQANADAVYTMLSASMGGTFYRWMAAGSKLLAEEIKDAQFTIRTGSPRENLLMLENGDAPIGVIAAGDYVELHPDDPKMEKTKLRMIWPIHPVYHYLIVPEKSAFQSIDDLKGKKQVVGIKGGEGGDHVRMVKALGWTEQDMKGFFFIGKTEGIEAYKDGTVDAVIAHGPVPNAVFMELASSKRGARLLALKEGECKKITAVYSSWVAGIIPAGSHEKITKDTGTVQTWYHICCREDFPADVTYKMAKTFDTRYNDLVAGFSGARDATAQNAVKFAMFKIHPGVARYLKEKGLLK